MENTTIDRISNSRYQNANKRYIIFVKKKKENSEKQVYLQNNTKLIINR